MSLKDTLKKAKQIERQLAQQDQKYESGSIAASSLLGATKPRNFLALNPLMQKGGIHDKEDIDSARKKHRRETKQQLRQTDWSSS